MAEQRPQTEYEPGELGTKSTVGPRFDAWLWRVYAFAFVLFLIASVRAALDGRLSSVYWAVLAVGAIPFVLLVRSMAAFPGRFSIGGRRSREAGRRGVVLLESQGGGGSIGGVRFERIDWRLHQYGLDIRIPGAGWGFVPAVAMRSVAKAPGGVQLEHWASEVRSPIELESSPDLRRLLELWIENREPSEASLP